MKLYCVRHGEALPPQENPQRPLTPKGQDDIKRLATWMTEQNISVSEIMHSDKQRSKDTALLFAETLNPERVYESSLGFDSITALEHVQELLPEWDKDVMIVGHMPFVSYCVSALVFNNPDHPIVDYPPGTVVCLANSGTDGWRIEWVLNPTVLC